MGLATLTSKGQMTLPRDVRERLALKTGDKVLFAFTEDGKVLLMPAKLSLRQLKGGLPVPAKPVSVKDMAKTIRRRRAGGS